jgi:glycosyltransferase involved in cell wall biosynthesis
MSKLSKITDSISKRLSLLYWSESFRYRTTRLRQYYRSGINSFWSSSQRVANSDSAFIRKRLWSNNRSYEGNARLNPADRSKLEPLLADIASGHSVDQDQLLPFLCLESKAERAEVNGMLADSYFQRQTTESLTQAADFMRRAWMLSDFSPDLLNLYLKIFTELKDVESIRGAYKRLGLEAGKRGQISDAIKYFTKWQWTYHLLLNLDHYEYDFDIIDCIDALAAPHRVTVPRKPAPASREKIRVAYLLRGMMDTNSNLIQISLEFARHHDRARFEVIFFTAETEPLVNGSDQGLEYLRQFKSLGYDVIMPADTGDLAKTLLDQAAAIRAFDPHIFVTSAALSDFSHYFLTSLRPAPLVMGIVQGPPAQFAAPILDWCISWTRHPLIECPTNCSWVEIKLDYPAQEIANPVNRKSLELPEDARVMLSGGRHTKFQSREFWQAIADLLKAHSNAYFVACGVRESEVPFFVEVVTEEIRPRVRCLGWRQDFLQIVPSADILLDTYPNGGGQTIVQAMASGVPVVAHRNDFLRSFTQTEWSPVEDFIRDPQLLVDRGDFVRFKEIVSRLIEDEPYRKELGERCRQEHVRVADPSKAIRGCEAVYERVVKLFAV